MWIPSKLPWQTQTQQAALSWWQRMGIGLARMRRWEFWPSWLYYGPIVLWILWLGIKHRNPTVFTAANPAMEAGGMVGERKHQALQPLQDNAPDLAARFVLVGQQALGQRIEQVLAFAEHNAWPVVLKPDVGQRGRGVHIARDRQQVAAYLERFDGDVIAQRYIAGEEYGVFVARMPGQQQVRILSIVHKTFPQVCGDGLHSLGELIVADARARLIASLLFARWAAELVRVPQAGEVVQLVEIGAHCRGSLFLDARELASPALQTTLQRLLDAVPGYAFGRMDLRVPSSAHFQRGEGLQVLELNGVSAESAHIYHPGTPLVEGYRAMLEQWSLAFEIGAAYARMGVPVTSARELLRLFCADLQRGQHWF